MNFHEDITEKFDDDNLRMERIIYWSPVKSEYVVEVPYIPKCKVTGSTLEEAIENSLYIVSEWGRVNDALGYKREKFYRSDFNDCYFFNGGFVLESKIKEFDSLSVEIDICLELEENVEKKNALLNLQKKIKHKKRGIEGENAVATSLSYCEGDMCILKNLSLNFVKKDFSAKKVEVDFIVFTHKNIYVIETKNWNSNVLIDDKGQIQTDYETLIGRSPIDQNLRQMKTVKEILRSYFKEFEYMDEIFQPLVVFTDLRKKVVIQTKKDDGLENQVIRLDSLILEIQKREKNSPYRFSKKDMHEYAGVLYSHSMNTCNEKAEDDFLGFYNEYKVLTGEKMIENIK